MLKYMLDTNICIFKIKNRPQQVREAFNRFHDQLCLSSIRLMELIYGAEKSANPEKTLQSWRGSQLALRYYRTMNWQQTIRANYVPNWPVTELLSAHTIN